MTAARVTEKAVSIVLLTTSDGQSPRQDDLHRMLGSVQAFAGRNPDSRIRHFLLMQRMTDADRQLLAARLPDFVTVHSIDHRVSLSKARNMLLSQKMAGGAIEGADVVGFPDDDCWYPDGTLERISSAFRDDSTLDFWFCRYGSAPVSPGTEPDIRPSLQTVIARAASNTIFFRGAVVRAIGGFDETLGVGATINGGEDTDYALRGYYRARQTRFLDLRCVGHRDFDPKLRSRYFAGSMVAIRRHAGRSPAGILAVLRKGAVGMALVATRRMTFGEFMNVLKLSARSGA